VRFVSPIALFLFTVFLMFFAVATIDASQVPPGVIKMDPVARQELKRDLNQAKEEISKAGGDAAAVGATEAALDKAEKSTDATPSSDKADAKDDDEDDPFAKPLGFDWRAISKKLAKKNITVGFGGPDAVERVRASLNDPDLLVFKLRSAASEFSFMLVPASVPFLWLMFFWKRRVYLYDHVIFSLHSLSFMALFVTLLIVGFEFHVGRQIESFWGWVFFVPPIHMFFHLRGTYGIGIFGALWRTFALSIIAMIVLCLYVGAILMLGLLH
jgi:hypothetical protein